MTQTFSLKLIERSPKPDLVAEEDFVGTRSAADSRLGDFWNENTPADGSRFRATLQVKGERAILSTIG